MNNNYSFQDYREAVGHLASYPLLGENLIYPALGLAGESGEVVDKIKKLWRNLGITSNKGLNEDQRRELKKEIGDVLWYLDALASELDSTLAEIAQLNVTKLTDRHARGVIKSEGDNR